MLRPENQKEVEREDKKFFCKQVIVAQENLYNKTIPTWASDFNLLTRVVKFQAEQLALRKCICPISR